MAGKGTTSRTHQWNAGERRASPPSSCRSAGRYGSAAGEDAVAVVREPARDARSRGPDPVRPPPSRATATAESGGADAGEGLGRVVAAPP